MPQETPLTVSSFTKVLPFVILFASVLGSWFTTNTKLALQGKDIDQIKESTQKIVEDAKEDNITLNQHEVRLTVLEQKKTSQVIKPLAGPSPSPILSQSIPSQSVVVNQSVPPSTETQKPQEKPSEPNKPDPTPFVVKVVDAVAETVEEILPL